MTSETPTHLLRIEGVNLSAVFDDTNEVSVRRGAGLMLRQAVKDIDKDFGELNSISLGASTGLFGLSSQDPASLIDRVADRLNRAYPQLTFVVDAVPIEGGFREARERVTAANRFRQYRQLTLVPPAPIADTDCCPIDRMRPAVPKTDRDNIKRSPASRSVIDRFHYGREQRQAFYSQELGKEVQDEFTDDLTELSEPGGLKGLGNLQHKMGVIYLDGNRFGGIQRDCATAQELAAFDRCIQDYRRGFLDRLLSNSRQDSGFHNGKRLRLETLLWGGDEILLVVPAWRGIQTLHWFFEESRDWRFCHKPLTHAAGIVFCHHKTPLAQARKTAEELANGVKTKDRSHNRFDYLVLESIDYPTEPLEDFCARRYWPDVKEDLPPLAPLASPSEAGDHEPPDAAGWDARARHLAGFLEGLPRGAILDVAHALVAFRRLKADSHPTEKDAECRFRERLKRLLEVGAHDTSSGERIKGDALKTKLHSLLFRPFGIPDDGDAHAGWLHLVELWDYLAPAVGRARGGAK